MRDVSGVTTATSFLGRRAALPLFVSAAAKAGFAHPTGEVGIAQGAAASGIPQMTPMLGSKTRLEMVAARRDIHVAAAETAAAGMRGPEGPEGQEGQGEEGARAGQEEAFPFSQFLQVYVDKDRTVTEAYVRSAAADGFAAVMITVDAAAVGKRERDLRLTPGGSAPRSKGGRWDTRLSWGDIGWLRGLTELPLLLKGVQCGADAVEAYR
jgi:L-lactate dehydrogenase (cytochrome)